MVVNIDGVNIDFWYNHTLREVTGLICYFNGATATYSGNIYKGSKIIGDFTSADSCALERVFAFTGFSFG